MIPFGNIQTLDCVNIPTPADPRCNDPAFALANPDVCPAGQQLIIKPGVALTCPLGSIQFSVFLLKNGNETQLTSGVIFSTSDIGIAMVGATSGNATAVADGDVTISATYQGSTVRAELTVIGAAGKCCDSVSVGMMLLVDNSRSMSQAFGSDYSTKLALAKAAAGQFADEVNTSKDLVGLIRFNDSEAVVLDSPTADNTAVSDDAAAIAATQQLTSFYDALALAIGELDASGVDRKVIVLFSDGVDQTAAYTSDNNPIDLLADFKTSGGIVICFGTRAAGKGYSLLSIFSTGGFFINAYGTNAQASLDYLSGIKGYICAGNCTPAGDTIEYVGQSNFTGWQNWTVTQGVVDLLGNGFYDALPGNGLYMDLRGSPVLSGNYDTPIIVSSSTYALQSGHVYRVTLDLAGNQAVSRPADTVTLRVLAGSVVVLSQTISMPDYTTGFQPHAFNFTAPSDMDVTIEISQSNSTGTDLSETQAGVLLGRVQLYDTTDLISLLDDDFDTENPTYIPPACGFGTAYGYYDGHYGYAYGYNCYGVGCLEAPPGPQLQDPFPQSDIEAGTTPPKTYSSTKTATVDCGSTGMNLSATNLVPVMTGPTTPSGVASASAENPSFQAYGAFDGVKLTGSLVANQVWQLTSPSFPVWLRYDFTAAQTVRHYELCCSNAYSGLNHPPTAWIFQGSNDGTNWDDLDTVTNVTFLVGQTRKYLVDTPAAYLYYRLYMTAGAGFDVIVFELEMFAAADQTASATESATSEVSQTEADNIAYGLALAAATALLNCQHIFTSTQSATVTCSYHLFPSTASASAISLNSQDEADREALAAATAAAEDARNCDQSTNNQEMTLNDNAAATPYPSVKSVTGFAGTVANVSVSITNLNQFFPVDLILVLQGPSGSAVVLMAKAGNAPAVDVSLIFDDTGATVAPAAGPLVDGATYKPGHNGAYSALPAPGPAQPHGTLLSIFNGTDPNGLWALWVIDSLSGSVSGSLESWDLTIT